jgi:hypothetical protein
VRDRSITLPLENQTISSHDFRVEKEQLIGMCSAGKLCEGVLLDGFGCRFYQLQKSSLVKGVQEGYHSLFHLCICCSEGESHSLQLNFLLTWRINNKFHQRLH